MEKSLYCYYSKYTKSSTLTPDSIVQIIGVINTLDVAEFCHHRINPFMGFTNAKITLRE